MNVLHVCTPHLSDVATVLWEIQKSHLSTVLFIYTSDCTTLLYCSLALSLQLFSVYY